jgi:rod shape-determining protein MreC
MSKKVVLSFLFISLFLGYIFSIEQDVKNKLNILNNQISLIILNNLTNIELFIDKYFNQLEYIEKLKVMIEEYYHYKLLYNIKEKEFLELQKLTQLKFKHNFNFIKVKVLSYLNLNDNSKVILDYSKLINDKIYALITYDGFSAGIVLKKNNQNIAYLNQNKRCNYTVYIGDDNIPGITSGFSQDGKLIIKHIPLWKKINLEDKVITSGMDNIFPFGIKVGIVKSINKGEITQEILIEPFSQILNQRYFYLFNSEISK